MPKFQLVCFSVLIVSILAACIVKSDLSRTQYPSGQTQIKDYGASVDILFVDFTDQTPGVAVAIVQDGKVIFQKGYGSANLEYNIPITSDTVFDVGSVSKQFTAFSIFMLEAQGKLSLDDNIRQYIPELPDFGETITIRHLCYHTSGLRDQWALLTLAGWRMDDVITGEQILDLLNHQTELNFSPSDQFMYSNTGYLLLAEIVAQVSGKSFRDFAQDEIFGPLGMDRTQVYESYNRIVPDRAYSYGVSPVGYEKRNLSGSVVGPTSVMSTANDLTKWAKNFQSAVVGNSELIHRINEIAQLNSGEKAILTVNAGGNVYVASGQFKWNFRGTPVYNHTGSTAGFESYLGRFPDKDFAVVVLSNQENFNTFEIGLTLADIFIGKEIEAPPKETKQGRTSSAAKPTHAISSDLSGFTGTYGNSNLFTSYEVIEQNDGLALKHIRHGNIPLVISGEDEFTGQVVFPVTVKFIRNEDAEVVSFNVSNFGIKSINFERE